ncbi:MAG: internal scaffolding protein [Microvirus sp.]|nr:MAG: internal scaffolding protein [Microvirus sp.]
MTKKVSENMRSDYDFYKTNGDRSSDLSYFEASLTRQEFAEECDINTLMARYEASGAISHVNRAMPVYLDTTDYPGLQASMDLFREAAASFNALPATVRREFDNDPQKFIDFASDAENLPRMREWGLAPPAEVAPGPVKVEVVSAPEAPKPV